MSKHHLRTEKICQNCGQPVDRFCNSCGQENMETRQSFGHLLRHFIEDFTHYEGNFWRTIKYLLFRPAYLTKTYLAGKRASYVAPVKLYIFISFVAFFLPGILPHINQETKTPSLIQTGLRTTSSAMDYLDGTVNPDTTAKPAAGAEPHDGTTQRRTTFSDFRSPEEYDSIQNTLPAAERDNWTDRFANRRLSHLNTLPPELLKEKLYDNLAHNFPKALFFYLPMFAFVIWIFHGKKRWLYFDHAIFTLHYFAFLLLLYTILGILRNCLPWHLLLAPNKTKFLYGLILPVWSVYYFFRAHHKLYGERRLISWAKSTGIYMINAVLFIIVLLSFFMFTIFNLH